MKLGGSVITDKGTYATFREDAARRLAHEMMDGLSRGPYKRMILVHGAGSFGHIRAHDHLIHLGASGARGPLRAVPEIRRDVRRLNLLLSDILVENGFHPVSLPPETVLHKRGDDDFTTVQEGIRSIQSYLENGFLPVLFGDVVADDERGFSICSGDDVMEILSRLPGVRRIAFATDVDGIYTEDPDGELTVLLDRCTPGELPEMAGGMDRNKFKDVTGSMGRKIRRISNMARHGEVWVVNGNVPGRLASFAAGGNTTGTLVR